MKKWFPVLLLAVLLAAAAFILLAPKGRPAPDFALQDLNGRTVTQAQLKGKVSLVNFWFPSCPGCVSEMPKLIRMAHDYQSRSPDFQIIGISMQVKSDPLPVVKQYVHTHQVPFAVLHDAEGRAGQAYNIVAAPTSFLVDKNGRIVKTLVGEPDFPELYRQVDALLAE
ncbi:MAG: TlpA disulfide reductase family protein [Eikenella sp.]|nr:TlpA disulfide reductase family protein [Eikenella sp.]